MKAQPNIPCVYIIQCSDGSLYTGWTTDCERRIKEHNSKSKGAKYTRGRQPVSLVYAERVADKSSALQREAVIKTLTRQEKLKLATHNSDKIFKY